MRNHVYKLSSYKSYKYNRSRQNFWTVFTIFGAIIFHIITIPTAVGSIISYYLKYGLVVAAIISTLGSIFYILFQPNYPKYHQNKENDVLDTEEFRVKANFLSPTQPISFSGPAQNRIINKDIQNPISSPLGIGSPISGTQNFDIDKVNDLVDKSWENMRKEEEINQKSSRNLYGKPSSAQDWFCRSHSISENYRSPEFNTNFNNRYDNYYHSKNQTPKQSDLKFHTYYPSPNASYVYSPYSNSQIMSPSYDDNIDYSYGSKISSKSIIKKDAYESLGLSNLVIMDSWTDNLKYVLGKYLHDVLIRFDAVIGEIIRHLSSQNLPQETLRLIFKILSLQSESERIGPSGELLDLQSVTQQCLRMNITLINEYEALYSIFCVRSSGGHSERRSYGFIPLETIRYIRDLGHSWKNEKYLRVDANHIIAKSLKGVNSAGSIMFFGTCTLFAIRSHSYRAIVYEKARGSAEEFIAFDTDFAMHIFFHMCDSMLQLTSRMQHRFSDEFYTDNDALIPYPSHHREHISEDNVKLGIVRSQTKPDHFTSRSIFSNISSFSQSNQNYFNISKPHFDVYVVHNLSYEPSSFDGNGGPNALPVKHVSRELLIVSDGRQNCYEAMIIFLIEIIRRRIHSLHGKSLFQSKLLEIFDAKDWNDLENELKDLGVPFEMN